MWNKLALCATEVNPMVDMERMMVMVMAVYFRTVLSMVGCGLWVGYRYLMLDSDGKLSVSLIT